MSEKIYDTAIIGGGLAGLALSIQLADMGYSVILFEKEEYPFHRVCGEYISMESWKFLEELSLPLAEMNLPLIRELTVSAPNGLVLRHELDPGGFGISRFKLDNDLKEIAIKKGACILQQHKVEDVISGGQGMRIVTSKGDFYASTCAGSFGKRSNLDIKWNRRFLTRKSSKLDNFIAVKYHLKADLADDVISLHNFKDGYCGISKIEDDKFCLCYLTTAKNLKRCNNSIPEMEAVVLSRNRYLKDIFERSIRLFPLPVTIAKISFHKKSIVENGILFLGDAAGMIAPLCGNGMSMALHGSKIAAKQLSRFLNHDVSREAMEANYKKEWKQAFAKRLGVGRLIQRFFGKTTVTDLFVKLMSASPKLTGLIIRNTHGKTF